MAGTMKRRYAGRRLQETWDEAPLEARQLLSAAPHKAAIVDHLEHGPAHVEFTRDPITFTNDLGVAVSINVICHGKFTFAVQPGQSLNNSVLQPGQSISASYVSQLPALHQRFTTVFSTARRSSQLVRANFEYVAY